MASIVGTASSDSLTGTSSADSIDGLAGDDILAGGLGNDTLDGGAHYDIADYSNAGGPVMVDLAAGTASGADGNDVLISIEDVWGSNFDDILIGNALDNILWDDQGNDTLAGGLGDDTMEGGADIDTALYVGHQAEYAIAYTGFGYVVSGAEGTDMLFGIERVRFADTNRALDLGPGEAAGNTVKIIGAAFGAPAIQEHPDYAGIGLDLFDSGASVLAVCQLAVKAMGSPTNEAFVNAVYANVVGVVPLAQAQDLYVGMLLGSGGSLSQAELLQLAAATEANAININLVGLQQTGVEFV
jgi:Ca2+-binding RTX toxin-like protein